MTTTLKHPKDLAIHPALAHTPHWDKDSPDLLALCDSLRDHGQLQEVLITAKNEIVDGRHRKWAAERMQMDLRCRVVPDGEVHSTIVASLLNRRHYTPGQRAYILFPHTERVLEESKHRRAHHLNGSAPPAKTLATLCAEHNLSTESLRQARDIHAAFDLWDDHKFAWRNHPEGSSGIEPGEQENTLSLREYFHPRLMDPDEPMGLGAVLKGIGGKLEAEGLTGDGQHQGKVSPDDLPKQLQLFIGTFKDLKKRFAYWQRLDPIAKERAVHAIGLTFDTMPPDLREKVAFAALADLSAFQAADLRALAKRIRSTLKPKR